MLTRAPCATMVTVYRLNTYPLVHVGLIHAFLNILALTPLLERFESEHGTLLTGALLGGRTSKPFPIHPAGWGRHTRPTVLLALSMSGIAPVEQDRWRAMSYEVLMRRQHSRPYPPDFTS